MGAYELGYDEIGEDYFVGEDDVDSILSGYEIGRRQRGRVQPRRMRGANQLARQAAAIRQADSGLLVRSSMPTKARLYPLGFDSVNTIAANAAANITNNPQVLFRPRRLVVQGGIAAQFIITDLKVGKNSQFAASGAVSGDTFAPDAVEVDLQCDTAQVNSQITLSVQNISAGALRFFATIFGDAAE